MRALAVVLLVALAAGSASAAEVRLLNGWFDPQRVDVEAEEPVTFVNADDRWHTVTSAWDDGATFDHVLQPGENVSLAFEAGTWPLYCVPHAAKGPSGAWEGMVATVDATEAPAEAVGPTADVSETPAAPFVLVLIAVGSAMLRRRAR